MSDASKPEAMSGHGVVRAPRRVVLTGGPGAGKTAVLEVVRKHLGDRVAVLPESAGIVYGGGFPRRPTPSCRRAAQLAIFHVQDQLERLALEESPEPLVLCDRGVIDGLAYWPGEPEEFFSAAGTTRAEALARYHAVVHLHTPPADGGYDHSNPLRVETPEEAALLDARLVSAWEGHPRRYFIQSEADFIEKLQRALAILRGEAEACDEAARLAPFA